MWAPKKTTKNNTHLALVRKPMQLSALYLTKLVL